MDESQSKNETTSLPLEAAIEAILFYKGDAVPISELSKITGVSKEDAEGEIAHLEASLSRRGLSLIRSEQGIMLGTNPAAAALIAEMRKEELERDPGNAGLEALTIILYRGPVSKPEIDYIRGVNSATVLRNLLIRGFIEKTADKEGGRAFLYHPTTDLLAYLGISRIEDLPEYDRMRNGLESEKVT
ncbi:SMC-Scp complex subunit ScpB [bacterium]|nr:SMC-Scp complex subunit ScpB [bacterium]